MRMKALVSNDRITRHFRRHQYSPRWITAALLSVVLVLSPRSLRGDEPSSPRERISFNTGWLFAKGDPSKTEGDLDYKTLLPWLRAANSEWSSKTNKAVRPEGNPGADVPCTSAG